MFNSFRAHWSTWLKKLGVEFAFSVACAFRSFIILQSCHSFIFSAGKYENMIKIKTLNYNKCD